MAQSELTSENIQQRLDLETGRSWLLFIRRTDNQVVPINIPQEATVFDVKNAYKRAIRKANYSQRLNWRYVWRTYWLTFDGQKLVDEKRKIKEYGIKNRSELKFLKRLRQK